MATEFTKATASPLKLEGELRGLGSTVPSAPGLQVYDDGTGGAIIVYDRTLTADETQEVEQVLDAHAADDPLVLSLEFVAAVFGGIPFIEAIGPSTAISAGIKAKGEGEFFAVARNHYFSDPSQQIGFLIECVVDHVNYVRYRSAATGNSPSFTVVGFDSNVNLNLVPRGTGRVQADGVNIPTISSTDTLTNKSIAATQLTGQVAVANGGTASSTAQTAINTLSNVAAATNEHVLTKDTASGNAIFKAAAGGGGTPGGSNTQVQYNNAGAFGGITGATTNGTALTLVAPILGTPASGVLTNCTGLPTAGLVDAAVTLAKMANLAQDQFVGRVTASTGVPETATITAAARTVLDDTTVAAMRTTLGISAAAGQTLVQFVPQMSEPPTANFATLDTRNNHPVLDFDAATDESAVFSAMMPRNYTAGASFQVILAWAATSATSGNVVWDVSWERLDTGQDMDSSGFAAVQSATATTSGTSGALIYTTITFTNAQADAIVAGEWFRMKVNRDANNASDTMTGDAELRGVEVREAP